MARPPDVELRTRVTDLAGRLDQLDNFEVLGITDKSSAHDLQQAFVRMTREYHPDRLASVGLLSLRPEAERIMTRVAEAHAVLTDGKRREAYVKDLAAGKKHEEQVGLIFSAEESFSRGEGFMKKGDFAGAWASFDEAAKANPDEPEYPAYAAFARFQDPWSNRDEMAASAEPILTKAVEEKKRFARGNFMLGEVWKHQNQIAKAKQAYRRAAAIDPNLIEALRELRLLEMRGGKVGPAQRVSTTPRPEPTAPFPEPTLSAPDAEGGALTPALSEGERGAEGPDRPRPAAARRSRKILIAAGGAVALIAVVAIVIGGSGDSAAPQAPDPASAAPQAPAVAAAEPLVQPPSAAAATPDATSAPAVPLWYVAPAGLKKGQLKVITRPPGAVVWVDGVERGPTPVDIDLGEGSHKLVVIKAGVRMVKKTVDTTSGLELIETLVEQPPPARGGAAGIKIRCGTEGKFPVLIDGQETGLLCPTERIDLPPGSHEIGIFVPAQGSVEAETHNLEPSRSSTRIRFKP